MTSGLKQQLFFRYCIIGEIRSIPCCLCFTGGTQSMVPQCGNLSMAEARQASGQGKGAGDGNRCRQAVVLDSISACVFLLWFLQVPQAGSEG